MEVKARWEDGCCLNFLNALIFSLSLFVFSSRVRDKKKRIISLISFMEILKNVKIF